MPTPQPDYQLAISHPSVGGSRWQYRLTVVTDVRPPHPCCTPIMDGVMVPARVPLHPDAIVWYWRSFGQDDADMAHLSTAYWRGEARYGAGAPAALASAAQDSRRRGGRVWVAWNPCLARWEISTHVAEDGVTPWCHPAWRILASFFGGERETLTHLHHRQTIAQPQTLRLCTRCGSPTMLPWHRGPEVLSCTACEQFLTMRGEFSFRVAPPIGLTGGSARDWYRRLPPLPRCPWAPPSAEVCHA